jgi:hypothetical protein
MGEMGTDKGLERDEKKKGERREVRRAWVLVCGLALLFAAYGVFMFLMIGDKGPPDWDFNVIEDIPGKSVYSTYPEPAGNPGPPTPQHVAGKPALSPANRKEEK